MRIAVLHFGQPRFLDLTHNYIKEEFNIENCQVDHFFHYWHDVGYNADDSISKNYDKIDSLVDIVKSFDPKMYMIESYTGEAVHIDRESERLVKPFPGLNTLCEAWELISRKFVAFNRKVPTPPANRLEYFFGQHYSMQSCFNMIRNYEDRCGFKYDIVVKTRADIVYRNKEVYKSIKQYNDTKVKYYTDMQFDIPAVNVGALRTNRWNTVEEVWRGKRLSHFYNSKGVRFENGEEIIHTYEDIESETIEGPADRLCFNDWSLIANRLAAEYYFGSWFEAYFITFGKNLLNNKSKDNWSSQSDHTLQGNIARYNNIYVTCHARRDVKVILEGKTPATSGKIVIPADGEVDIQQQIVKRFTK